MNDSNEVEHKPDDGDPKEEPQQSALMWTLGCLGKTLLIFVVLVALVFGACLMVISG